MKKISGQELIRRVNHICGGSVDLVDINKENSLSVLYFCLQHEKQHKERITMIRALKTRIKTIWR